MAKAKSSAKKSKAVAKKAATKPVKARVAKSSAKAAPKKKSAVKTSMKTSAKGASKKTSAKPASKVSTAKTGATKKPSPAKASVTKGSSSSAALRADFTDFMTPLDDRILVRVSATPRRTAGGLFIPDTVADVSGNLQGIVVAVGRGHRNKKGQIRPLDVSLGDEVVFAQFAGSKISLLGEELILVREGELMGVVS